MVHTVQAPQGQGEAMHALARRLWPICRSITGDGVRETLSIIREALPELDVVEVPSGTEVFDWTVPDEWNITDAYIEGPDGSRVVDFADSNLHVISYSVPTDVRLTLEELQEHLHSLPEQPTAIPYLTSYYSRQWGFCLADEQRKSLKSGEYRAVIDATLEPGSLTYAELVIPGETTDEVFVSTYVCHPSLANNELSGPVVSAAVANWVAGLPRRRFTYRFVFLPETIGSLTYLSRNLEHLRAHVVAGLNLTCIGDERAYSYLPSRKPDSWVDRVTRHVLSRRPDYTAYTFLDRGSDERQYCAPGIDLPVASVMRSKYGVYPEYHTSLDDLDFVTPAGLQGGFDAVCEILTVLENDDVYRVTTLGEPRLGKHGLYHSIGGQEFSDRTRLISDIVAYADGETSLLDMAELFGCPVVEMLEPVAELVSKGLLVHVDRRPGDRMGSA